MVIFVEGDEKLYYFRGTFTSSNGDHTAKRLYSSVKGVGETFFIGSTTETIGSFGNVFASYTVGWASSITSDLGTTINGNTYFGVVLPSHVSNSCVTDAHSDLTIHL